MTIGNLELSILLPAFLAGLLGLALLALVPVLAKRLLMRRARIADVERLDPGVRRLINPHIYHVSLSEQLWELKQRLIQTAVKRKT